MTRLLFIFVCCAGISACAQDDAADYCRDHNLFHSEHLDSLGKLSVNMADDGVLSIELTLPASTLVDTLDNRLLDPRRVYSLQTEKDCVGATSDGRRGEDMFLGRYESQCGLDNKIGQLDVVLFDTLAALEELEVYVVTPVTQKRFAISRQCESAIFRLD